MISNPSLHDRLLGFPIDEGSPVLTFEARLARENGWAVPYSRRVIREYRRFVYLAMTVDHSVSPSEAVDQAWHMHLTYTRSYWDRLCGEVLGRPLHHGPTRGGSDESAKFLNLYERTLGAYRTAFGEEAPSDIWPPADLRFGDDLKFVRVNRSQNWVVPKGAVRRSASLAALAVAAALFTTGCSSDAVNPFALYRLEFVKFLIPVLVTAFLLGMVLRRFVRGPGAQPGDDSPNLDWADAAFLAGGHHRLTAAAIARLVQGGEIRLSDDGNSLELSSPGTDAGVLSPVEAAVAHSLPVSRHEREGLSTVAGMVENAFADRASELRSAGYILSPGGRFAAGLAAAFPLATVFLFLEIPRLVMGIQNGRPIGILLAVLALTAIAAVATFACSLDRLSRRGKNAIGRMRLNTRRHLEGDEGAAPAALAVALFGTSALDGCDSAELAALMVWYPHSTTDAGGGCGTGGGCGGGGCGGGCGGCGGGCG